MNANSHTSTFLGAARRHEQLRRGRSRFPRHLECVSGSSSQEKEQIKKLTSYGLSSQHCGEFDLAQRYFEEALALSENTYGLTHHRTAVVTLLLSKACRLNGKSVEAELLRDRAKEMFEHGHHQPAAGGSTGFWALLAY